PAERHRPATTRRVTARSRPARGGWESTPVEARTAARPRPCLTAAGLGEPPTPVVSVFYYREDPVGVDSREAWDGRCGGVPVGCRWWPARLYARARTLTSLSLATPLRAHSASVRRPKNRRCDRRTAANSAARSASAKRLKSPTWA